MSSITKTDATRRAQRHLSYGHYATPSGGIYVNCPNCREQITRPRTPLATKSQHRLLLDDLVEHLVDYCEVTR